MALFSHEPLPEAGAHIRLLTLWPSDHLDDPIVCDMTAVKLADSIRTLKQPSWADKRPAQCPKYAALSYSWGMNDTGDATPIREIMINGKKKAVSQNLFEGLLRIRERTKSSSLAKWLSKTETLHIWIDALCIDQDNLEERSTQVGLMHCIYRFATRMIIWLGEGCSEQDDRAALSLFKCSTAQYSKYAGTWFDESLVFQDGYPKQHNVQSEHSWTSSNGKTLHACLAGAKGHGQGDQVEVIDEMAQVLNRFTSRRYFSRRWVLQEAFFGRTDAHCDIYWGPVRVPHSSSSSIVRSGIFSTMQLIQTAATTSGYESKFDQDRWQATYTLLGMHDSGAAKSTPSHDQADTADHMTDEDAQALLALLEYGSPYNCSEPRDRLYAITSFRPGCGIASDYKISTEAAYTDFTRRLITSGYLATILLNVVSPRRDDEEDSKDKLSLPSWVPDLRRPFRMTGPYAFNQSTTRASFEGDTLKCKLGHMGIVDSVSETQVVIRPACGKQLSQRLIFDVAQGGDLFAQHLSRVQHGDWLTRLLDQGDWNGQGVCVLRRSVDDATAYHIIGHFDLNYAEAELVDDSADKGSSNAMITSWSTLAEWTVEVDLRVQ